MLHRLALLSLAVLFSLSYAPGCATPPVERIANTSPALTLGAGPAAAALAVCVCSTCASDCADTCAPGMTEITGAACKACTSTADPMGCADEFAAYQLETTPTDPASCALDNPDAPACAADYTDPPECAETIVGCYVDGELQCPAGYAAGICCPSGAPYPFWMCVLPSAGAGGAGGSP